MKFHFKTWIKAENIVVGVVANAPSFQSKFVNIQLKTRQIGDQNENLHPCQGKLHLTFKNDGQLRGLSFGDLIVLNARIEAIKAPLNPRSFDYREFLRLKNMDYRAFVKNDEWRVLAERKGNPLLDWAFKTRSTFLKTLKQYLGKNTRPRADVDNFPDMFAADHTAHGAALRPVIPVVRDIGAQYFLFFPIHGSPSWLRAPKICVKT